MGTAQVAFEGVVRGGGATGSHVGHVTGSGPDGSQVTESPLPEICSAHAQPEVAQYPP